MKNKKFVIRKVPLNKFMNLLTELYNSGADYIDLYGEINKDELQDNITVAVPIEYMTEESQAAADPSPPPGVMEEVEDTEITEDEISDLLRHV